jgi:hypothetical protein
MRSRCGGKIYHVTGHAPAVDCRKAGLLERPEGLTCFAKGPAWNNGKRAARPRGFVIRIGPAGWKYKDWEGVVYPNPAPRGFDPLAYDELISTVVKCRRYR